MTNNQIISIAKKYLGESVDVDGAYGAQCVDFSNRVAMDADGTRFTGNAIDMPLHRRSRQMGLDPQYYYICA